MNFNHCDQLTFIKLKKRLQKLSQLDFNICSGSMAPLIMVGDQISVKPIEQDLSPFDIIVFWNGEQLIAHFVWHKNRIKVFKKESVITRSLQNPYENDLPINEENILGYVTNFEISTFTKISIFLKCIIKRAL